MLTTGMGISRSPQLVSVGYEGREVDDLVSHLLRESVDVLVDVRLTPISRKPGLSKRRLTEALASVGVSYVHFRELGNPKENREGFRAGDQLAFQKYRDLLQEDGAKRALTHVSELLDNEVVALLCFEREHEQCHRGLVAEALVQQVPQLAVRRP